MDSKYECVLERPRCHGRGGKQFCAKSPRDLWCFCLDYFATNYNATLSDPSMILHETQYSNKAKLKPDKQTMKPAKQKRVVTRLLKFTCVDGRDEEFLGDGVLEAFGNHSRIVVGALCGQRLVLQSAQYHPIVAGNASSR